VKCSLAVPLVPLLHRAVIVWIAAASLSCNSSTQSIAGCTGRRDTPWCRMDDGELQVAIEQAGGRVFIGFRNPGASAGVDEQGHNLTSASVVADGKAWLRSIGVVIEFESQLPYVAAQMEPSLLQQIRHKSFVEYVEPIFPGTFFQSRRTVPPEAP
jgi:hypothetical protein